MGMIGCETAECRSTSSPSPLPFWVSPLVVRSAAAGWVAFGPVAVAFPNRRQPLIRYHLRANHRPQPVCFPAASELMIGVVGRWSLFVQERPTAAGHRSQVVHLR